MKARAAILALGVFVATVVQSFAVPIVWTDWVSGTSGTPDTVTGTMTIGDQVITVTYTGEMSFIQTSGGTNYWTQYDPPPYTSAIVDNPPSNSDLIGLDRGDGVLHTLTFSAAVLNPVMAVVSMGQLGTPVLYEFNSPFTVLSSGRGFWGQGDFYDQGNNTLIGVEGHGAIQFTGNYTTLSWTTPTAEYWHGFTVGVEGLAPVVTPPVGAVPEPGTMALFIMGGLLMATATWRKARQKA